MAGTDPRQPIARWLAFDGAYRYKVTSLSKVANRTPCPSKKSDLYSSLWASCDELRGGMDASQYKDYVLFMLFIKYVTDKYAAAMTSPRRSSFPKGPVSRT
jgi:hypothetical protein